MLVFGFYHPNKTAIFWVDWCGRPASHNCPHYLCWISSTCDYRSYRVFTFLIVGFCRVKPQLHGDNFKISSLKDFSLRSVILPAIWWLKFVDIQCPPNTPERFLGCIWALDYTTNFGCLHLANTSNSKRVYIQTLLLYKTGLVEKGLFHQSNLATTCFQEENFNSFQNVSYNPTHQPIPRKSHGKM
jgi:hypothetical protein